MEKKRARLYPCCVNPMVMIAQALLAYTYRNFNATDEWSEWFWHSFRARRAH